MSLASQKTQPLTSTRSPISNWGSYSIALIVVTLLLDILAAWFLQSSDARGSMYYSIGIGLLVGQLSFFVLLFGLRGSSWTDGFLACCLAVSLGFAAVIVGAGIALRLRFPDFPRPLLPPMDTFTPAFLFPGVMFAAMSPLWLARRWFGWRLEQSDRSSPRPRFHSSISGLFFNIVILAGIVMTLRAPQVIWGFSPIVYWPSCGIVGVVIAIVFAGFTLPLARILNIRGGFMQFACVVLLAAAVWSVIGFLPILLSKLGSSILRSLTVPYSSLAISGVAAASILFLGVRAILADGFALQTFEGVTKTRALPSDQKRRLRISIAQAALVAVVAFAVNIYIGRVTTERRVLRDAGLAIQEIVGPGGLVGSSTEGLNPILPSLRMVHAPNATDAEIERIFALLREANALDGLEQLVLRDAQVTDTIIPIVGQAAKLKVLDVSGTNVTGVSFAGLKELRLTHFYASDLDLTSVAWDELNVEILMALSVSGSKLSTESFASFLDQTFDSLHTLNVAKTEIDEPLMKSIAGLLKRSRPNGVGRLVHLSETSVSDKDVALLKGASVHTLDIAATNVTDACVDSLADIEGLYSLDIGRTRLTDASLPKLLHLGAYVIIMPDTKLTAKALLSDPSPGTLELIVREGNFTPKELAALQKAGFMIGEDAAWLK